MSNEKLSESIAVLRREIESIDNTDEETNQQLLKLADLLEQRLNQQSQPSEQSSGVHTINQNESDNAILTLVENYEARHPKITAMANDLMTRLMSMGI